MPCTQEACSGLPVSCANGIVRGKAFENDDRKVEDAHLDAVAFHCQKEA